MQTTSKLSALGTQQNKKALAGSSILYRTAFASMALVAVSAGDAVALPTGASIESGGVSMNTPTSKDLVINQTTDRAIINWQNFDILHGESTRFNQPNANAVALNRIGGGSPSQILGTLSANGKLILVNPNGVFFGSGAQVDVAGLVATSADISSSNFLSDKLIFDKPGKANASIINKGTITAHDGGLVALVAPGVRNDGVIQANLGTVALGAGSTATIDMYGDNLYSFALGESKKAGRDDKGHQMGSGVENNGMIISQGGHVLLTANVAKNIVTNVVNNSGVIEASAARVVGGSIVLDGGAHGNVRVSGTLDASGKADQQQGGSVTVTGENITLTNATIDALGVTAGGSVLIGGGQGGNGDLAHASNVSGDKNTVIEVSALDNGNAGNVVLWSDDSTEFSGSIFANAGINGGNGGLVEVSSGNNLDYTGFTDVHGVNGGAAGTLLLDPRNITITNALASAIEATLNHDGNVEIATPATGHQAGNIKVNSAIDWYGAGSLILNAFNDIIVNRDITATNTSGTGSAGAVTLEAGNNVSLNNATISTARGDINVSSNQVTLINSEIAAQRGDIVIDNSGAFYSNTADAIHNDANDGGKIWINQTQDGSIQNALDAIGSRGWAGAKVTLAAGSWNEQVLINKGNTTLTGQGDSSIINAPWFMDSYVTASGTTITPVVYADAVTDVTVSNLLVNGAPISTPTKKPVFFFEARREDDMPILEKGASANVGIAFNNTGFSSVDGATVTNVTGDGILFDTTVQSSVVNSTITNLLAIPELEMGSGIHTINSAFITLDGNTINNTGWDGIKIHNDANDTISNNDISNTVRVGIYAEGLTDSAITGNTLNNTNTDLTGFGAIVAAGGAGNLTIADNNIGNVTYGSGILVSGLTGTNAITGNLIHDTNGDGIDIFQTSDDVKGILVANNLVGLQDREGTFGTAGNIQGDGILIDGSNGALVSANMIVQTLGLPETEKGSGIHLVNSDRVTVDSNTINNTGWDGIKIAGGSNDTFSNNVIDNTVRVGIYAEGLTDSAITGNTLTHTTMDLTGFGAITAAGGSGNLTIADNTIGYVANGSGIQVDDLTGINTITGNSIHDTNGNGIEVLTNWSDLLISENNIGFFGAEMPGDAGNINGNGIYLVNANAQVANNTITNVALDGINAFDGYGAFDGNHIDNAGRSGISLLNEYDSSVTNNDIANVGAEGIQVNYSNQLRIERNTVTNAFDGIALKSDYDISVDSNTISDVDGAGITANMIRVGNNENYGFFKSFKSKYSAEDRTDISNNDISGAGADGINLYSVENAYVTGNTISNVGGNGINAVNLYTVDDSYYGNDMSVNALSFKAPIFDGPSTPVEPWGSHEQSIIAGNSVSAAGFDGISLYSVENAYVTENTISNVAGNGISLFNATTNWETSTVVANNTVSFAQANGIALNSVENAYVVDNTIHDIGWVSEVPTDGPVKSAIKVRNVTGNGIYAINLYTSDEYEGPELAVNQESWGENPYVGEAGRSVISNNEIFSLKNDGIYLRNAENVSVNDNTIYSLGQDGINAANLTVSTNEPMVITPDSFVLFNDSVSGGDSVVGAVDDVDTSLLISDISRNHIHDVGNDGIHLDSVENANVTANDIHDLSNDGIYATNLYTTSTPDLNYRATLDGNTIASVGGDGIYAQDLQNASITNNTISNATQDGIFAVNVLTDDSKHSGNGSYANAYFGANNVSASSEDGIHIEFINNAEVAYNTVDSVGRAGIYLNNSENTSIHNNSVSASPFGMKFDYSFAPTIFDNTISDNGIGVELAVSDNASLSGDLFNGNTLGINIDNALFSRLDNETINTPFDGAGLRLANGASGIIVKDSAFNGGNVGIEVDGADSDMAFEGNGSTFTGNNYYIVMENGGMVGKTLDASQQTFDGIRASDFTQAELAAAETNHTYDLDDDATLGNVFYKAVEVTPPVTPEPPVVTPPDVTPTTPTTPDAPQVTQPVTFDTTVLDDFQTNRRNVYRRGNFSYAGRAMNFIADPLQQGTFDPRNANLSLLNRASPTAAADIANLFATLAPAAGGNQTPQQLASLAPAAGGKSPSQNAGGGSCANSFLGDGFASGFQCTVQ